MASPSKRSAKLQRAMDSPCNDPGAPAPTLGRKVAAKRQRDAAYKGVVLQVEVLADMEASGKKVSARALSEELAEKVRCFPLDSSTGPLTAFTRGDLKLKRAP
jgi:hypothetical protein